MQSKIIIARVSDDGRVAIVSPAPDTGLTLKEIGDRTGLPWRLCTQFPDAPPEQWRWTDEGPLAVADALGGA